MQMQTLIVATHDFVNGRVSYSVEHESKQIIKN